jgi:hypothetical protein
LADERWPQCGSLISQESFNFSTNCMPAPRQIAVDAAVFANGRQIFDRDTCASPRGETACVRRTGIRAKRNTPKKARKFKHLEPPLREVRRQLQRSADEK